MTSRVPKVKFEHILHYIPIICVVLNIKIYTYKSCIRFIVCKLSISNISDISDISDMKYNK